jgi:hypothetical protein
VSIEYSKESSVFLSKKTKAKSMNHDNLSRVLYLTLVGVFVNALVVMAFYSYVQTAQATPGTLQFGGPILWEVPTPIPTFSGICPAHTVILDYSKGIPDLMAFSIPNGFNVSAGVTFDYENVYTPGVQTLGEVNIIPLVTCAGLFPYPVYTTFFNPTYLKFQVGTSLLPAT